MLFVAKMKIAAELVAAVILAGATAVNVAEAAEPEVPAYSWQEPHARVLPSGNLEWAPRPFVFEKGASMRYIDFGAGDDTRDGRTQQTAWKHHPWDANATGAAKACNGVYTYVFKGGVVYRGALKAGESGFRRKSSFVASMKSGSPTREWESRLCFWRSANSGMSRPLCQYRL